MLLACSLAVFFSCKNESNSIETPSTEQSENKVNDQKIVSLSGAVTETLALLGEEKNIVGTDVTSTYPASVKEHAQDLGHVMSITAEPLITLQPTVVFGSSKDLKPELIDQVKKAGIEVKIIDQDFTIEGSKKLIKTVAESIGNTNYQQYIDAIDTKIKDLKPLAKKPKVLFIYARGAGTLMIAGNNTPMKSIIEIAGGENAVNDVDDYKPLTPEALINANPDYLLFFDKGLESLGGVEGAIKLEGVSATNAGKNKKIISMDGQLLSGFGPRVADAAVQLNELIQK